MIGASLRSRPGHGSSEPTDPAFRSPEAAAVDCVHAQRQDARASGAAVGGGVRARLVATVPDRLYRRHGLSPSTATTCSARTLARQVGMQYAYEDRIAALRAELDRVTSRHVVETQGVEDQIAVLLERQAVDRTPAVGARRADGEGARHGRRGRRGGYARTARTARRRGRRAAPAEASSRSPSRRRAGSRQHHHRRADPRVRRRRQRRGATTTSSRCWCSVSRRSTTRRSSSPARSMR